MGRYPPVPMRSGEQRMDGYKVVRGSGVSMTSPEGSVLLASMFGDTFGPDDVEVFPIALQVASVMSPHLHTADLVAWVTGGQMAFGFGRGSPIGSSSSPTT